MLAEKDDLQLKNILHRSLGWLQEEWDTVLILILTACMMAGCIWYSIRYMERPEQMIRQGIVDIAERHLGCSEADGSHRQIVDYYNSLDFLPRDYKVTYEDNWCATFASAVAQEAVLQDYIPMECSCQQQILLFGQLGAWEENDCYLPKPGDYIYYVWDEWRDGDCTAWANHVGIVTDTFGPIIKVIEGNKDDAVGYRYIFLNDITIRGFGTPDYRKAAETK